MKQVIELQGRVVPWACATRFRPFRCHDCLMWQQGPPPLPEVGRMTAADSSARWRPATDRH